MNPEKINFFENSLLFVVQADSGQTVSFRLDTQKLLRLLVSFVLLFIVFISGTLLFFKERKTNELLSQQLLVKQVSSTPVETAHEQSKVTGNLKARLQEFNSTCRGETCVANLVLTAQEKTHAEGSLLVLLETLSPQIGTGNPAGISRQKYYVYPEQKVKDNLTQEEIFALNSKPFYISRSLNSKAEFTIGRFQVPVAMHLYLFDVKHELIKHETVQVSGEDKNDP